MNASREPDTIRFVTHAIWFGDRAEYIIRFRRLSNGSSVTAGLGLITWQNDETMIARMADR
jgi:hypothetical protein